MGSRLSATRQEKRSRVMSCDGSDRPALWPLPVVGSLTPRVAMTQARRSCLWSARVLPDHLRETRMRRPA